MIISVSRVKNSADIIESFIRYNANIVDLFIITDANSTDNTAYILQLLKAEGYPIELYSTDDLAFTQGPNNTHLLQYAYYKYHPDYILPLDDDEFLVPSSGTTLAEVKNTILHLPKDKLYYLQYQTYFPDMSDHLEEMDSVKRITHYYPFQYSLSKKTLLPAALIDSTTSFVEGCHNIVGSKITAYSFSNDIQLAHFPCRSTKQAISKLLIGRWAFLLYPNRASDMGLHYIQLYDQLKEDSSKYITLVNDLVKQYVLPDAVPLIREHDFIGDKLTLKYTAFSEFNLFRSITEYVESIIEKLMNPESK